MLFSTRLCAHAIRSRVLCRDPVDSTDPQVCNMLTALLHFRLLLKKHFCSIDVWLSNYLFIDTVYKFSHLVTYLTHSFASAVGCYIRATLLYF